MGQIIVGYDGTDPAKAALDEAIGLAKDLGDKLVLVFGDSPGGYGGGEVQAQREAVHELAEKVTSEGLARAKAAGIDADVQRERKHPVDAMNDAAAKRKARMIIVGSQGETLIKGVMLGSNAYKLLHLAEVPVLVVRMQQAD
jgi:nucleotide-binding universal stress UspA family protein